MPRRLRSQPVHPRLLCLTDICYFRVFIVVVYDVWQRGARENGLFVSVIAIFINRDDRSRNLQSLLQAAGFAYLFNALISLMYANVVGRTVNFKLTSMNMTSLLNFEREARTGDATAVHSRSRSEPSLIGPCRASPERRP